MSKPIQHGGISYTTRQVIAEMEDMKEAVDHLAAASHHLGKASDKVSDLRNYERLSKRQDEVEYARQYYAAQLADMRHTLIRAIEEGEQ